MKHIWYKNKKTYISDTDLMLERIFEFKWSRVEINGKLVPIIPVAKWLSEKK